MSLLNDINEALAKKSNLRGDCVEDYVDNVEVVSDEFNDSGRWTERWTTIVRRGGELVAIDYEVPSTEMQEGSEGDSEAYAVESYEVTVTKYRRKQ